MKGIIMAGGSGTRLYPLTKVISKQLLPVYDKPMIYYPLSTLMLGGIRDILLISTPAHILHFQDLLEDGSQFGIRLSYAVQEEPGGLAQAFLIGEEFLAGGPCTMVLGDNVFYGGRLGKTLREAALSAAGGFATIFGYYSKDPRRFGVMELDAGKNVLSVEEKPRQPKSNYCITGLYVYDGRASRLAKRLRPSARNELEITDLNRLYLEEGKLRAQILGRDFAWMDVGTIDSLMEAAVFVESVQNCRGEVISAPEEIAYREKWIDKGRLLAAAAGYGNSPYGEHLRRVSADQFLVQGDGK